MRTVFVNPSASFSNPRKRRKRRKAKPAAASRPRKRRTSSPRRRRRRSVYVTKRGGGMRRVNARRRNAGITPFVANPLANPRRRRRKGKRNPGLAGLMQPKVVITKIAMLGAGSAVGTAANLFGLRRIENDWFRNGARVLAAVAGALVVPGDAGASMAGATLYPMWAEISMKLGLVEAPATEIDLNEMGIDLEDIMDGEDGGDILFDP